MVERIIGAAIQHADGEVYSLPPPARHHDVIRLMGARFNDRREEGHEQGFITSSGAFVDRKSAWVLAERAGQLLPRAPTGPPGTLFSEDVW